jgi:hypothetical protein
MKTNVYKAMLKRLRTIVSQDARNWVVDKKDFFEEMNRRDLDVGRYPVGFRQYENYENYRTVHHAASLSDYVNDSKTYI